jgi:hypothetical protein
VLNPDFRDMLSVLSAANAEFLLVGAYALAAHGLPRATGDMDIWIRRSPDNAARVWEALRQYGAPLRDLAVADLEQPGVVFQVGVAPRRIDILTSIDGVEFEEAWPLREVVRLDDLSVPVISHAHLIRNKKAVGRPQDLADVSWLEGNSPS